MSASDADAAARDRRLRDAVLAEFVATEAQFLADLDVLQRRFIDPLTRDKAVLAASRNLDKGNKGDILMLFHTIGLIAAGNREFLDALAAAVEVGSQRGVGAAVQRLADEHFDYYSVFCNHQAEAMADAARLCKTSGAFRRICDAAQAAPEARGLGLQDYLVKPFQRLLKYPLLLRELIRRTPAGHADRAPLEQAADKIQHVVDEVNRNKAKADNLKHMLALNERISGLPRALEPLAQPTRRLVREGWSQKISGGNDQERHLSLFNDLLLYCKRRGGDKLQFRGAIELPAIELRDLADTDKLSNAFELHRLDKKLTYTFYFPSPTVKREWWRALRAAKETVRTLALSTAQYSDQNEFKHVIGAVRLYFEDDGQQLFKTFAIGTQVTARDMLVQFAVKLRIVDALAERGDDLELSVRKGNAEEPVASDASPLAMQLELIKSGVEFPSDTHRFFVRLPASTAELRRAAQRASGGSGAQTLDLTHLLKKMDANSARKKSAASLPPVHPSDASSSAAADRDDVDRSTSPLVGGTWSAGNGGASDVDVAALIASVAVDSHREEPAGADRKLSNSGTTDRPSESADSDRAAGAGSGLGSNIDLLDAVLSNDTKTLRRVVKRVATEQTLRRGVGGAGLTLDDKTAAEVDASVDAVIGNVVASAADEPVAAENTVDKTSAAEDKTSATEAETTKTEVSAETETTEVCNDAAAKAEAGPDAALAETTTDAGPAQAKTKYSAEPRPRTISAALKDSDPLSMAAFEPTKQAPKLPKKAKVPRPSLGESTLPRVQPQTAVPPRFATAKRSDNTSEARRSPMLSAQRRTKSTERISASKPARPPKTVSRAQSVAVLKRPPPSLPRKTGISFGTHRMTDVKAVKRVSLPLHAADASAPPPPSKKAPKRASLPVRASASNKVEPEQDASKPDRPVADEQPRAADAADDEKREAGAQKDGDKASATEETATADDKDSAVEAEASDATVDDERPAAAAITPSAARKALVSTDSERRVATLKLLPQPVPKSADAGDKKPETPSAPNSTLLDELLEMGSERETPAVAGAPPPAPELLEPNVSKPPSLFKKGLKALTPTKAKKKPTAAELAQFETESEVEF